MSDQEHVSLGFSKIPRSQKTHAVQNIFEGVADHYDVMNDFMSLGMHRMWKFHAIRYMHLHDNIKLLDLAAGSGDMTAEALKVHPNIECTLADASEPMLAQAKKRFGNVISNYINTTAESMPFTNASFDRIIISFGFRNFTDQEKSLHECIRCLKDDGILGILEFSKPKSALFQKMYQAYAHQIIPKIGQLVCSNPDAYQYLAESIDVHPDAESVSDMILRVGFNDVQCHSFCAGLVRLHIASK